MTDSLVDVLASTLTELVNWQHPTPKNLRTAIEIALKRAEAAGKVVIDKACEVEPRSYVERYNLGGGEHHAKRVDLWQELSAPAGTVKVYIVREELRR